MKAKERDKLDKIADELERVIEKYLEIILAECGPRGLLAMLSSTGTTMLANAIILTKLDENTPPTTAEIGELLTIMLQTINEKSLKQERVEAMHEALRVYGFVEDHRNPYTCRPSH